MTKSLMKAFLMFRLILAFAFLLSPHWASANDLGLTDPGNPSGESTDRPNILWITVEDMSPTLGCWGDAYANTPNIDRFAKEAVRYVNAFATAPVCSPARSCLITGVYATSLGTQDLRSAFPIPEFIHGWPSQLRKEGYFTSNNFKTDYNTSDEQRLINESWDRNGNQVHWRQRNADQPFFSVFNDMVTHQSRTGVWPKSAFVDEVQNRLKSSDLHDPQSAILPPYYPDTRLVRDGVARFYDCVSVMDQNFGKLIDQLKEDGLYDDTIIFFFSDHGSGMPRGKRLLHDSGLNVPLLIRFPKKYQQLAPATNGTTVDRLVSFVDFPPTMLNLLGLEVPEYMQGKPFLGASSQDEREFVFGARDRVDEAYDKARSVRDKKFLYIRNYRPYLSYNQPSLYSDFSAVRNQITDLAKRNQLNGFQMGYAGPKRSVEELYDTQQDPHNLFNLADKPEFREVLIRMRSAQSKWIKETRDLGFLPEEEVWQLLDRDSTPYEIARQTTRFPADVVLDAANKIGDSSAISEQKNWAVNENRAVQFQVVIGLRAQAKLDDEAITILERCTRSESSAVRTEAAAELVAQGKAEFLATLVEEMESEDENRVLRACRAIQLLGKKTDSLIPQMESVFRRWQNKNDSPIPLFIRFSLEASLKARGKTVENRFNPY